MNTHHCGQLGMSLHVYVCIKCGCVHMFYFVLVYKATAPEGNVITAFLLLMGINVLFAIFASAFIVIEVSFIKSL